jgi:hypothetical protein
LTHHLGIQVVREDDAGVHLVWTTEFAPASMMDTALTTMRTLAEIMKKTINTAFTGER